MTAESRASRESLGLAEIASLLGPDADEDDAAVLLRDTAGMVELVEASVQERRSGDHGSLARAVESIVGPLDSETTSAALVSWALGRPLTGGAATTGWRAGVASNGGVVAATVARRLVETAAPDELEACRDEVLAEAAAGVVDATTAAVALLSLRGDPAGAPALFLTAAAETLLTDPQRALDWVEALAGLPAPDTAWRAEIELLGLVATGRSADAVERADDLVRQGVDTPIATLVTALGFCRIGRWEPAADAYEIADPSGATGLGCHHLGRAARAIGTLSDQRPPAAPAPATLGARAASALADATEAVPSDTTVAMAALRDAAELARPRDVALWPDRAEVLDGLLASLVGNHDDAIDILDATDGAHDAVDRIRLSQGWCRLRKGDWRGAERSVQESHDRPLALRDQLLLAGLRVALVHRRGGGRPLDGELRTARELVRRHPIDLLSLPAHAEIAWGLASADQAAAARSLVEQLTTFITPVSSDSPLRSLVARTALMVEMTAAADTSIVADAAAILETSSDRWQGVGRLVEQHPADPILLREFTGELADGGEVLEAGTVAGWVALRVSDTRSASPLLELVRDLRSRLPADDPVDSGGVGALSPREIEVAREVMAGRTYKEIAANLFISAKTVEHHVSHIRTKLGATSRAEMLTMLFEAL